MTTDLEFNTVVDADQAQQLGTILCQCFNFSIHNWQHSVEILGWENLRIIQRANQVLGGLAIYPMGQWFGGQPVPTGGVAAVGVAAEHRGSGVAAELMRQLLKELQAKDIPLSTLYASTQRFYRKVGYEPAGNACRFTVPTHSLIPGDRLLICPVAPTRQDIFHGLYRQQAVATNGNLERHPAIWKRVLEPVDQVVYAYLIGDENQPEGYVVFNQQPTASGYNLQIRDLVLLTPAAGRALWTFFANQRSLANNVLWSGPAVDPLLAFLSEQTYQVTHLERWLLRIVNVHQALELRGYPAPLETELHLAIQDDLLPGNHGRFILELAKGRGVVRKGGRGEVQLHVRGLTPLYTGLFTPHQLQAIGLLEAPSAALAAASQIFAGPEPWMLDHF